MMTIFESFPDIDVDPNPITLTAVEVGEESARAVTLRNAGRAQLVVTEIRFSESLNPEEFEIQHPALPLTLEAGDEIPLRLIYARRTSA